MVNLTITSTAPVQVLGPVQNVAGITRARWVIIQNQGSTNLYLQFDGYAELAPVTSGTGCGYLLVPGDSINFSPVVPKGSEGCFSIWVVAPSGSGQLHCQHAGYEHR